MEAEEEEDSDAKRDNTEVLLDQLSDAFEAVSADKKKSDPNRYVSAADMEYANKELEAAKAAHRKLVEEKNALKEALNSRASKVQVCLLK